jgi:hypothetical protein
MVLEPRAAALKFTYMTLPFSMPDFLVFNYFLYTLETMQPYTTFYIS